jgi:adenine deaminase
MKPIRPLSKEKFQQLIEASRFQRASTTVIQGGRVLNVYTGEIMKVNIAIYYDRIAYLGLKEPCIDENTTVIDGSDFFLVPGYIEPHSHPFQLYNPIELGKYALARGTTTLINDNLTFFQRLDQNQMEQIFEFFSTLPVKNFWWARLDPQCVQPEMLERFTNERVKRTLEHPLVLQAGELTAWSELLNGDEGMLEKMYFAKHSGKRIEAHNPGASAETLNAVAAAGVTCCHESITAEEVIRRIRLGIYATLRHSSIRPDIPELIGGLLKEGFVGWNRLMMTTDGSTPFFLENGFTDYILKLAIKAGLNPVEAYRMVTLNPATYYGIDGEIGGIAPGRIADILFLKDLSEPTPIKVMADGKLSAKNGKLIVDFPEPDWNELGMVAQVPNNKAQLDLKIQPEYFRIESPNESAFPVMEMMNSAILRLRYEKLPERNGEIILDSLEGYLYASLVNRQRKWVTTGILKGFGRVDALASTYTASQDVVILGRDHEQMAKAANRVTQMGGGIVLYEKGEVIYELPLPLVGGMSRDPMDKLIRETSELVSLLQQRGYCHEDPIYTLIFLSATHLPMVRLTAEGILSVKTNKVLVPPKRLS